MKKTPSERLREERQAKKWSQQKLADEMLRLFQIKISRESISQWESGDSKSQKPENMFAAAKVLGLNPQWVMDGSGKQYLDEQPPSSNAMKIAYDYDKLDDIGKSFINDKMDQAWIETQARARGVELPSVKSVTKKQ